MSTGISWTDETWNVLAGCTPVSEGCRFCYAAGTALAPRLTRHPTERVRRKYEGVSRRAGDGRAVFTGVVNADLTLLGKPLGWTKPRRVFVNSMSDLWHSAVSPGLIAAHFAVMAAADTHLFQVLTKRPERQRRGLEWDGIQDAIRDAAARMLEHDAPEEFGLEEEARRRKLAPIAVHGPPSWPLPNVVLGTSAEDQEAANRRVPHLVATPAALRFISMEPLLGPIDLERCGAMEMDPDATVLATGGGIQWRGVVDQLAIGGESNQTQPDRARPMELEWVRDILEQARAAGILCHVKQLGTEYARSHDGVTGQGTDPEEWPEDLRVQQDIPMPQLHS